MCTAIFVSTSVFAISMVSGIYEDGRIYVASDNMYVTGEGSIIRYTGNVSAYIAGFRLISNDIVINLLHNKDENGSIRSVSLQSISTSGVVKIASTPQAIVGDNYIAIINGFYYDNSSKSITSTGDAIVSSNDDIVHTKGIKIQL